MSFDDRLSFGGGPLGGGLPPEEPPAEPADKPKSNRAFIFIAIAMGGLILLGILALAATFLIVVPQRKQAAAQSLTKTVMAVTLQAESITSTPTSTPTLLPPTGTPTLPPTMTKAPTATATRVVRDEATETPAPAATRQTSLEWGADKKTPAAGLGSFGIVSIAVGLTGLILAARRLRK